MPICPALSIFQSDNAGGVSCVRSLTDIIFLQVVSGSGHLAPWCLLVGYSEVSEVSSFESQPPSLHNQSFPNASQATFVPCRLQEWRCHHSSRPSVPAPVIRPRTRRTASLGLFTPTCIASNMIFTLREPSARLIKPSSYRYTDSRFLVRVPWFGNAQITLELLANSGPRSTNVDAAPRMASQRHTVQ